MRRWREKKARRILQQQLLHINSKSKGMDGVCHIFIFSMNTDKLVNISYEAICVVLPWYVSPMTFQMAFFIFIAVAIIVV